MDRFVVFQLPGQAWLPVKRRRITCFRREDVRLGFTAVARDTGAGLDSVVAIFALRKVGRSNSAAASRSISG